MNDEINRLLARIEALENAGVSDDIKAKIDIINRLTLPPSITKQCDCKADIESLQTQLDELNKPADLSGFVKKDDLEKSVGELKEDIKAAKFDAFAFDSARRTFGEEIAVLKSFVDKGFSELRKELETLKDSKELESELKSYIDKEFRKLKGGNNG